MHRWTYVSIIGLVAAISACIIVYGITSMKAFETSVADTGMTDQGPDEECDEFVRKVVPAVIADDTPYLTADFPIENTTTRDISLRTVQTSCGCSDAALDKALLRPGERATLRVGVQLQVRQGPLRVICHVKDDTGKRRSFAIESVVYGRARFAEPATHFGFVEPKVVVQRELIFVCASAAESGLPKGVTFRADSSHFTLGTIGEEVEHKSDGIWVKKFRLPVQLTPPKSEGAGSGSVIATYRDEGGERTVCTGIDWYVKKVFAASPSSVFVTSEERKTGGTIKKAVTVRREDGRPFVFQSIESPHAAVEVAVHNSSVNQVVLDITIDKTGRTDFP
jgi:hypothetical protein